MKLNTKAFTLLCLLVINKGRLHMADVSKSLGGGDSRFYCLRSESWFVLCFAPFYVIIKKYGIDSRTVRQHAEEICATT